MWRHHCGVEAALNGGGALSCGKAAAVGVIDLHCTGSHLDLFWISFESHCQGNGNLCKAVSLKLESGT